MTATAPNVSALTCGLSRSRMLNRFRTGKDFAFSTFFCRLPRPFFAVGCTGAACRSDFKHTSPSEIRCRRKLLEKPAGYYSNVDHFSVADKIALIFPPPNAQWI